jgi:UDP-N-acetylmuramate--alanine ligase
MKLTDIHKVHFIGVGGIGMSGLARLFLHEGKVVSGSDKSRTANSEQLAVDGVILTYEQSPDNIQSDIDVVVYSDGVTKETTGWAELEAARAAGILTISYFEALGHIANDYYLIAVAGTHGKTTTTAMLADVLEEADFDPTVIVGSLRAKSGTNYRAGKGKYFIVEADEYLRHFLYFTPDILVITNIDFDHPDYFTDLADVQSAFTELVGKVPAEGFVVADTKNPQVAPVLSGAQAGVRNYSEHINIVRPMHQPGLHNRQNAAAAETVTRLLNVDAEMIDKALTEFSGTARRFEYKGELNGALIYDDYAHNPQKVAAAIAGARELHPTKKIIVVFQPHTYTRTNELFADFVEALATADEIIILPIYAAREKNVSGMTHTKLVEALVGVGQSAHAREEFDSVVSELKSNLKESDVVLVMGAGDVTEVAKYLTE